MDKGIGKSNGKIILSGEHSVVYGAPAIALPFNLAEVICEITPAQSGIHFESDLYVGELKNIPDLMRGIKILIEHLIETFNIKVGLNISVLSKIPAQRGFGSSAAVTIAIIKSFYDYTNATLTKHELRKLSNIAEEINHKNPSGIDTETIISNKVLYYDRYNDNKELSFNLDAELIVVDTGTPASTKEAVQRVANNLENNFPNLEQLGLLTKEIKGNIENCDLTSLGENMTRSHRLLRKIQVSNDKLDDFVEIALRSGAYGAKLSGGGLGGCMIILSAKDKTTNILKNLKDHYDFQYWAINLKEI